MMNSVKRMIEEMEERKKEVCTQSRGNGKTTLGSSVTLTVTDKSSADLGPPTNPGLGKVGNFFVDTAAVAPNQFTFQEAKNNNVFIGIASGSDNDITKAMAVYYVAAGERFRAGDLVKVEMIGVSMAVDFNARGANSVTLIHNDNNEFEFQ